MGLDLIENFILIEYILNIRNDKLIGMIIIWYLNEYILFEECGREECYDLFNFILI